MVTSLGWSDPVEDKLVLRYRRKGEACEDNNFQGSVYIIDLGTEELKLTHIEREQLPNPLDLTRVPVIGIGGKRKWQHLRVREFLGANPGFSGAFLLWPGSGNWDLGEGMLFVTSQEVIEGKRISGGRPEVQLTNFRWERDGRYLADRCKMLHGKVLETLETGLEQEPGLALIVETMFGYGFEHPLKSQLAAVLCDLRELETRRLVFEAGSPRDFVAEIKKLITTKLEASGDVRRVSEIPVDITVEAEEIAPELVAQCETLGTVEIPGVGRRRAVLQSTQNKSGNTPVVTVDLEEVHQITNWPFTNIDLRVKEIDGSGPFNGSHWSAPIFQEGENRWPAILGEIEKSWVRVQRDRNYPKEMLTGDPVENGIPALPEMVKWGEDFSGQAFVTYPGYENHWRVGWRITWFEDAEEASSHDFVARQKAAYLIRYDLYFKDMAAEGKEFPLSMPSMDGMEQENCRRIHEFCQEIEGL
ncbi:MAG: hypothetical protein WCO23_01360, partial [bacterium]